MSKYIRTIFKHLIFLLLIFAVSIINWLFPLYDWISDTGIIRFIWLGIFFILLDIFIEIILAAVKQFRLMGQTMSFGRDIKKISGIFWIASNVSLSSNLKADFVVVGSSGVWLVSVQDDGGKIEFNGDDLVQNSIILRGLLTKTLEKAYSLAGLIKRNLNRDFIISPVIAFSSPQASLESVPKSVRGVYLASRKDIVSLIENTDIQLIDENMIKEIYSIISKSGRNLNK